MHFFGSKAFFAAAMTWPFDTDAAVAEVLGGPRTELGTRLASFFLSVWEDPSGASRSWSCCAPPRPSRGRRAAARDADVGLPRTLGTRLGVPDPELRMSLCSAQLIGLGTARYIVGLEPLASLEPERVVELVGPALQRYMTGSL